MMSGADVSTDAESRAVETQFTKASGGIEPQSPVPEQTVKSKITTMTTLPSELLLHIFALLIQWNDKDWENDGGIDWRAITLSHVCSLWRALVLDTSTLWTCLTFHRFPAIRARIMRSKAQHVHIVYFRKFDPTGRFIPRLELALRDTSTRWRSVLWESSEAKMQDMLSVLHHGTSFPKLRTLELGVDNRGLPGTSLSPGVDSRNVECTLFPLLERICLSRISVSELPPTHLPSLRSLTLHWPAHYPASRATLFRMSSLSAFLRRAPQLEVLTFSNSTPLIDVHLRLESDDHTQMTANERRTYVSPVDMRNLEHVEWSCAPAQDLWRLFSFVKATNLRRLEFHLDVIEKRWHMYDGMTVLPMDGSHPFSIAPGCPLIRFDKLEELSIFGSDTDGLCCAVKRMEFPELKKLTLGFLRSRATRIWKPPNQRQGQAGWLPSIESMFREPRFVKVTHLTLSDFKMEQPIIMSMLAYLKALESLTFDCCTGAGAVICALSGTACGSPPGTLRRWTCPRLQSLAILDSDDVTFACLAETVLARKQYSEGTASRNMPPDQKTRPMKPLRKLGPISYATSINQCLSDSSPNGSFIAGWPSHQLLLPLPIRSIHIEGCNISEEQLYSLDGEYGVENLVWSE